MSVMESSNGGGGRVAQRAVGERSEAAAERAERAERAGAPDPELLERPRRRRFSAEYKLRIVRAADACSRPGEIGALLRREGLYSSLLTEWRRARDAGALEALERPRGRKPPHPLETENADLRRRAERAEAELEKAKRVIEVQGNVSALLGELLEPRGASTSTER
jgi:transposase